MIVLVLIFLTFAAFIRILLELYKKIIRKDKASVWEIRDAQKKIEEIRKEEAPKAVPAPSSASERLSRLNGMRNDGDS